MTFQSHHAHIVIGNTSPHNKQSICEYLGVGTQDFETSSEFIFDEYHFLGVDDARKIAHFLQQTSPENKKIIYMISVVVMSNQAQNAFLKLFEEPKKGVTIILLTPHEHTVLPTLRSRVLMHYLAVADVVSPIDVKLFFHAPLVSKLAMVDAFLKKIASNEEDHEEGRYQAKLFLDAYEAFLYQQKNISAYRTHFDAIFFAKQFIHLSGFSIKQVLQHITFHS